MKTKPGSTEVLTHRVYSRGGWCITEESNGHAIWKWNEDSEVWVMVEYWSDEEGTVSDVIDRMYKGYIYEN